MYGFSYLFYFLLHTNTLSCIIYTCGLRFLFSSCLFLSIIIFLRSLIDYQYAMDGVFIIMSRPNTNCTDMACRVFWYAVCTAKAVSANIPEQG